jgi:hypothetical protein
MQRLRLVGLTVLVPALAAFLLSGCSNSDNKGGGSVTVNKGSDTTRTGRTGGGAKSELASDGWATIKGKVTYDGTPPAMTDLPIDKDKDHCLSAKAKAEGDTKDQTWKVGADGGVADVAVWVRPAEKNKWFKIPDDKKQRTDTVVVDQPYCAFHPHVSVLNPSYYDGSKKQQIPTGQKFHVVNDATIAHNTKIAPSDTNVNTEANKLLPASKAQGKPQGGELPYEAAASEENKFGGEQLLTFNCDVHKWMRGYAWVFDHPFAAVTSGDLKTDTDHGSYTINEVPAGADLEVVYWHEGMTKPMVAKKINLKKGETADVSFKISQ